MMAGSDTGTGSQRTPSGELAVLQQGVMTTS